MSDETENPNIEWKNNKGFSSTEKISRRIDKNKVAREEAKTKQPLALSKGKRSFSKDLPQGIKKLRKKIKDVYDEDEDEDEIYTFAPNEMSSLMNELNYDERKQLGMRNQTLNNQKMQQESAKQNAILNANKLSKDFGLGALNQKVINSKMQDASLPDRDFGKVLKDDVISKTKIKTKNLSEAETVNLLRGVKRIKKVVAKDKKADIKAIEGLKIDDIINVGQKEMDENKIAETILKKSGRKIDKNKKRVAKAIKENTPNLSKKNRETICKIEKERC